jgi:hypothetical protein
MSPLRAAVGIEVLADVLELAELRSKILRVRGPAESEPAADRQRYNCLESFIADPSLSCSGYVLEPDACPYAVSGWT